MPNLKQPTILALDFDGVICDGSIEYFQTAKRTYLQIWQQEDSIELNNLATDYYKLRPVIEVGWEMPILIRAMVLGISHTEIFQNWSTICRQIVDSDKLNPQEIGKQLDTIRDRWIESDLEEWLTLHRFYPGVIDRLGKIMNSTTELYVVSTKEGRFIDRLLEQNEIKLLSAAIIGKECKQPKYETLRQLINNKDDVSLWFVEDRLKTLEIVHKQPDLEKIELFLADWGYNTTKDRETANSDTSIHLLSLQQFDRDFSSWLPDLNS
jgi:phosphoglycolate phosphatase-like HAD superfamily hydrolase